MKINIKKAFFFGILSSVLVFAQISPSALAYSTTTGTEFKANPTTFGDQEDSAVATDSSGNFVVVWTDRGGNDGSGAGIFAQRFDNTGTPVGAEIGVNTSVLGNQEVPDVAMNASGAFVVVWTDVNAPDASLSGVMARLYDNTGSPVTGEMLVNSATLGDQEEPRVAMDSSGGFVVTWTDHSQGNADIRAQRFDASGTMVCIDGSASPAGCADDADDTNGIEPEFLVNTTTGGAQFQPGIAVNASGAFVIIWTDGSGADGSGNGVFAQIYTSAGATVGSEFQVNTTTLANQFSEDVGMDSSGNFVVVFNESGAPFSTPTFQRYNSAGVAQGGEFIVDPGSNQNSDRENMRISMESTGEFVIVWQDRDARDGDGDGAYFRRFSNLGVPLGNETQANTSYLGDQTNPNVSTRDGGSFIVTWTDENGLDTSGNGVYAQRFIEVPDTAPNAISTLSGLSGDSQVTLSWDAPFNGGSAITDYIVEFDGGSGYQVFSDGVSATTGALVTGLTNGTSYSFRVSAVNTIGTGSASNIVMVTPNEPPPATEPSGPEFQVNTTTTGDQNSNGMAGNNDGVFVIVWTDFSSGDADIRAGLFDNDGTPLVPEFVVNSTTAGDQFDASVAINDSGDFVIVWRDDNGNDGDGAGIFAQMYDSSGTPVGGEFQVNTQSSGDQFEPFVGIDDAGNFVVVWNDNDGTDGDLLGVFGQLYDNTGTPIGGEIQINNETDDNQFVTGVAMDASGNFVAVWRDENGLDGDQTGVFARLFDITGTPFDDQFQVNTQTDGDQDEPRVAMTSNGLFVVIWTDHNDTDGDNNGVFAQLYDNTGTPIGTETTVNTETLGDQDGLWVAINDVYGYLVVFSDPNGLDGDGDGIFAREFDLTSTPKDDQFLVNTYTADDQSNARVAYADNGIAVVSWESFQQDDDSDGNGIFAQLYAVPGVSVSSGSGGRRHVVVEELTEEDLVTLPQDEIDHILGQMDQSLDLRSSAGTGSSAYPFLGSLANGFVGPQLELLNLIRALQVSYSWMYPQDYQQSASARRVFVRAEKLLRSRNVFHLIGQALQLRNNLAVHRFVFRHPVQQKLKHVLDLKKAFVLSLGTFCATPERLEKAQSYDFPGALEWGVGYENEIGLIFSKLLPWGTRNWDFIDNWPILSLYELVLLDYCDITL